MPVVRRSDIDPDKCPFCRSDDISVDPHPEDTDRVEGYVQYSVRCSACDLYYDIVYELEFDYVEFEEPDPEPVEEDDPRQLKMFSTENTKGEGI